jgi:endonuclease/exonuclease/phosphatase family metal-dependent hydrolase
MDGKGVRRLAAALGMDFVYYPAVIHPVTDRDFGNAVLSRWPIREDRKIILPHLGLTRRSERIAVCATVVVRGRPIRAYSVQLATPWELGPGARRDQIRTVLVDAEMTSDPVVIGGDMNSSHIGEEAERRGFLWPTRHLGPTVSLFDVDHIFLRGFSPADTIRAGRVRNNLGASDHRPVWTTIVPSGARAGEALPVAGQLFFDNTCEKR